MLLLSCVFDFHRTSHRIFWTWFERPELKRWNRNKSSTKAKAKHTGATNPESYWISSTVSVQLSGFCLVYATVFTSHFVSQQTSIRPRQQFPSTSWDLNILSCVEANKGSTDDIIAHSVHQLFGSAAAAVVYHLTSSQPTQLNIEHRLWWG